MLSKRLTTIAKMVPSHKVVFDVGSDHALLPCYLIEEGISELVYAGDNKEGPLNSAITNIKIHHLEDKVKTVLSDGLDKVSDDVEVVVIAGMGYHTATAIMDKADLSKYALIIVQVNKNVDLLREYISSHNYLIVDEDVIFEDDKYYEIVAFKALGGKKLNYQEINFGPVLMKKGSDVFKDYLNYRYHSLKEVLRCVNNPSDERYKLLKEMELLKEDIA